MPPKNPPNMVARIRIALTEYPMARAASLLSPAVRRISPQRVVFKAQTSRGANTTPMRKRALICKAARTCDTLLHQPKSIAGRIDAVGSMSGLPR